MLRRIGWTLFNMGERGHTLHVRDGHASDALTRIGHRVAILGSNERWTSFVPLDTASFDDEVASATLDHPLVHIWFDDDFGVVMQVHSAGDFVGELSLPTDQLSTADLDLLQKLEALDVVTNTQRAALVDRISMADECREWTLEYGLEKLLELPFYMPMPSDVSASELRSVLPDNVTITKPVKSKKTTSRTRQKNTSSSRAMQPRKESWNEKELATVKLHCEYWCKIFSLNNWSLYNRYKKHLPANQRLDVDAFVDIIVGYDDDEKVSRLVQDVLARIWDCEDWDAVIRDPKLIDGHDHVWQEWLTRVSAP